MAKHPVVYIMTMRTNRVLYTGVTTDLQRRVGEHRDGVPKGFTARYRVSRLVYFEEFDDICDAIAREKQIKAGPREKKLALVESTNPGWLDLAEDWP